MKSMISRKKKIIELEGQRGVLQIILLLQKNKELLYGKLYNNKPHVEISNNSTAKRALNLLKKNNLVIERKVNGGNGKYYSLTEKGKRFARLLNKMEQMLEEK
jgi:predicted transcriptional regulator